MFQFHKVRLKVFIVLNYSAIFMFQFHKVRLKAPRNQPGKAEGGFQFHKVRLKEDFDDIDIIVDTCFNSIRYD